MKKIIISSCILSFITITSFFYYEILEVNSENWMFIPSFYASLSLCYLYVGGLIGILFFNVDSRPKMKEEDYVEKKYISSGPSSPRRLGYYSQKSRKKSSNDSSKT